MFRTFTPASYLGRGGDNLRQGPNQRRFGPSFVHIVYFLRKSVDFHAMRKECKRILFHFLLLIYHKYPSCDKLCPLPYSLPIFVPPSIFILLLSWSTVI